MPKPPTRIKAALELDTRSVQWGRVAFRGHTLHFDGGMWVLLLWLEVCPEVAGVESLRLEAAARIKEGGGS